MFRSLLVPLDRTSFAEQALPLAVAIASRAGAHLHLAEVHALYELDEPEYGRAPHDPERDAECRNQEQLYLDATAKWITAASPLPITTGVLPGSAVLSETIADGILEQARHHNTDLIVLASHKRGPLSRFAFGSVTLELVRRSGLPVLRVPSREPAPERAPEIDVAHVLVPLDGSALAERALEPALELARLLEARCTLLQIIGPDESELMGPAEQYLDRMAGLASSNGVEVRTRVVVAADVAGAIVTAVDEQPRTLVALATHGRGGLKRLALGSIAERVVRGTSAPVLIYHPV